MGLGIWTNISPIDDELNPRLVLLDDFWGDICLFILLM